MSDREKLLVLRLIAAIEDVRSPVRITVPLHPQTPLREALDQGDLLRTQRVAALEAVMAACKELCS